MTGQEGGLAHELQRLEQEYARLLSSDAVRHWNARGPNTGTAEPPAELVAAGWTAARLMTIVAALTNDALQAMVDARHASSRAANGPRGSCEHSCAGGE